MSGNRVVVQRRRTVVRPRLVVLLLAVSLVPGACGGDGASTGEPGDGAPGGGDRPPAVAGREFVSVAVRGHELVAGTEVVLSFGDDGTLGAHAGCNSLSGDWSLDGGVLVVGPMGGTEMGCDEDRMAQDEWLVGVLTARPSLSLDGDTLTLTAGAVTLELLDREVARPDRPLTGTRWVVDTVFAGGPDGTAASVPTGAEAWIELTGTEVRGFDTCNSFSGPVEVAGATVTFGTLRATLAGCDDLGLVDVLRGEVAASVEGNRLTLTAADGRGFSFIAR